MIPPPDWESLIEQVADDIVKEHTPAQIMRVRVKLYDLLTHCIPPTIILKVRQNRTHAYICDHADFEERRLCGRSFRRSIPCSRRRW